MFAIVCHRFQADSPGWISLVDGHHIWPWEWGGPTDLDNLGWCAGSITNSCTSTAGASRWARSRGMVHWFGPGNRLYEPGRVGSVAA